MDRKKFLRKGLLGIGSIISIPSLFNACTKKDENIDPNACVPSPTETGGPFPIKTPAEWVRENIVGNRSGIALQINLTIQNTNNNCIPIEGVRVDIWQCDSKGNYSEYNNQLDGNFTNHHFLRGRQITNTNGQVTFMSFYPGWYPGRAPHLHIEIKDSSDKSLLITQIAFPEETSTDVYTTADYNGNFDTSNASDGEFSDSLSRNIIDNISGNITDGYTLTKTIKVSG